MANVNLTLILRDLAEHLAQLVLTLEAEHVALTENDMENIIRTATDKNRLFDFIEDLENERHALLQAAGLDLNSSGIMAYLQRHTAPTKDETIAIWEQIETLTRQCRKQNQINGIILEKNRQRTEKALAILKGQTPQVTTYTASGETSHSQIHHSLAKA
ncbi:hypothetical protein MNBD_GAMMA25-274 [hydrothermal vent metagenome]|uniref:Flagellar biosynthesis protein FlgN n=1 Tax=hydrothermal vent metagenome TaxID=652676 RepID=A0A3B1BEP4_9ZZZZ